MLLVSVGFRQWLRQWRELVVVLVVALRLAVVWVVNAPAWSSYFPLDEMGHCMREPTSFHRSRGLSFVAVYSLLGGSRGQLPWPHPLLGVTVEDPSRCPREPGRVVGAGLVCVHVRVLRSPLVPATLQTTPWNMRLLWTTNWLINRFNSTWYLFLLVHLF